MPTRNIYKKSRSISFEKKEAKKGKNVKCFEKRALINDMKYETITNIQDNNHRYNKNTLHRTNEQNNIDKTLHCKQRNIQTKDRRQTKET